MQFIMKIRESSHWMQQPQHLCLGQFPIIHCDFYLNLVLQREIIMGIQHFAGNQSVVC